jgi:hypothetical protein
MKKILILGALTPFGYSKYEKDIDKNKKIYYNKIEFKNVLLDKGCGNKVNILL